MRRELFRVVFSLAVAAAGVLAVAAVASTQPAPPAAKVPPCNCGCMKTGQCQCKNCCERTADPNYKPGDCASCIQIPGSSGCLEVGYWKPDGTGDAAFVLSNGKCHGWYLAKSKLYYPLVNGVYGTPFPYTQTISPPVVSVPAFQPFGGFFRGFGGGCSSCGGR